MDTAPKTQSMFPDGQALPENTPLNSVGSKPTGESRTKWRSQKQQSAIISEIRELEMETSMHVRKGDNYFILAARSLGVDLNLPSNYPLIVSEMRRLQLLNGNRSFAVGDLIRTLDYEQLKLLAFERLGMD